MEVCEAIEMGRYGQEGFCMAVQTSTVLVDQPKSVLAQACHTSVQGISGHWGIARLSWVSWLGASAYPEEHPVRRRRRCSISLECSGPAERIQTSHERKRKEQLNGCKVDCMHAWMTEYLDAHMNICKKQEKDGLENHCC